MRVREWISVEQRTGAQVQQSLKVFSAQSECSAGCSAGGMRCAEQLRAQDGLQFTARRLTLLSAHVGCNKVWLARLHTKGVRITEAGSLKQGAIPCVEFYLAHHCSRVAEAGSIPMCRVLEYVMRCAYQGACQTVV